MKKILTALLTIVLGMHLNAAPVTSSAAKTAAQNWYQNHVSVSKSVEVKSQWAAKSSTGTAFYVFNFAQGGFVMISADDVATPILGYAAEGEIAENSDNPALNEWLNSYKSQIDKLVANKADRNAVAGEWNNVLSGNIAKADRAVTPLVTTTWDQSPYYNMYCPKKGTSLTVVGCVATAASQVLKFWNHPNTGVGSHSYIWDMDDTNSSTNQTITTAFDSTFNFSIMPNKLISSTPIDQKKAVAKLSYRLGVAVEMDYGVAGSGAFTENLVHAMKNYFKYDKGLSIKALENYTQDNWIAMLKTELDAGRPMVYAGSDPNGGHAFVCDGYDSSTPTKFHFNWGWSGSADGYFAIGALNSGNGNFNDNNRVIIGIKPKTTLTCNIDAPADSSSIPLGQSMSIVANVYDAAKSIAKVEFFVDGVLKTTDTSYPYSYDFNTSEYTMGYHTFKATATDGANNTDSDEIAINIAFGNWEVQNTGFTAASRGINNIFIVSDQVVWATAYDGSSTNAKIQEFTKTVNGGTTWTPYKDKIATPATSYGIGNLSPLSATVAWACIYPQTATMTKCGIYKTTDGGTTWTKQATALFNTAGKSFANFVHMFDENNGFCQGDPAGGYFEMYTTADGGANWVRVPQANIGGGYTPVADEYGTVNIYCTVGTTAWFLTTKGNVFKSTDKGLTWTMTAGAAPGNEGSVSINFIDENNGILVYNTAASGDAVYKYRKTTDGGATWTDLVSNGPIYNDMTPIPGTTSEWMSVSASQAGPGSSYSFDNGANWVAIDAGTQYTDVNFYSKTVGWAGGFSQNATTGGIFKWKSVGIDGEDNASVIPQNASLKQNYPNPFNPTTTIEFNLKGNSMVNLTVYDAMGREVAQLANGNYLAGNHAVQFDAGRMAAGVYFYSLKVQGQNAEVKKMMLIK